MALPEKSTEVDYVKNIVKVLPVDLKAHAHAIGFVNFGAISAFRHMMISTVRGEFAGVTGTVTHDPKDPTQDAVEATIDCATVNTGVAKLDAQLKSADFFDVAHYPTMKFNSKRVERAGDGKLEVTGDLTINATTQEVVLDVDGLSGGPRGNEKIGLSGHAAVCHPNHGCMGRNQSPGISRSQREPLAFHRER